jgi:hypothetical protein
MIFSLTDFLISYPKIIPNLIIIEGFHTKGGYTQKLVVLSLVLN